MTRHAELLAQWFKETCPSSRTLPADAKVVVVHHRVHESDMAEYLENLDAYVEVGISQREKLQ